LFKDIIKETVVISMARPKKYTIRLLEEESKVILDTPVGREAIRNVLKKQVSTSQKRLLVHPVKRIPRIHSLHGGCP